LQQIRTLLDPVAPRFMSFVKPIGADGGLAWLRVLDGRPPVALDGTEHHCSEAIRCPQRLARTPAHGYTGYHHTALTTVIVAPGQKTVLPLAPEFVAPEEEQAKQVCELNAGALAATPGRAVAGVAHHHAGR
jgi:hypothetical protein